jgi:hypothetical protein
VASWIISFRSVYFALGGIAYGDPEAPRGSDRIEQSQMRCFTITSRHTAYLARGPTSRLVALGVRKQNLSRSAEGRTFGKRLVPISTSGKCMLPFSLSGNCERLKNGGFSHSCGNHLLPTAAKSWVKSTEETSIGKPSAPRTTVTLTRSLTARGHQPLSRQWEKTPNISRYHQKAQAQAKRITFLPTESPRPEKSIPEIRSTGRGLEDILRGDGYKTKAREFFLIFTNSEACAIYGYLLNVRQGGCIRSPRPVNSIRWLLAEFLHC